MRKLAESISISASQSRRHKPFARSGLSKPTEKAFSRLIIIAQIVLSHFSMSTADLGPTESFPHRQLRTTTDVVCPPSLSFVHGGLHLQVTHHLFPRLPRHNLRKASILVKEFAKERGLVYAEFGFKEGNEEIVGVLRGVAEQVGIMGRVADAEVREKLQMPILKAPKSKAA